MTGQRVPAVREVRKLKGEFTAKRQQRQAVSKIFNAGIYQGLHGRVLTNYVKKVLSATTC